MMPTPVPGLVADAVAVFSGVGEPKSKFSSMREEPAKLPRAGESGLQTEIGWRSNIKCASGVVFAVAGGGDEPENGGDRFAGGELGADDRGLARDAAVAGQGQQANAIRGRGLLHRPPGGGCARSEAHRPAVVRGPADRDEPHRHALPGNLPARLVVRRDAKPAMESAELGAGIDRHGATTDDPAAAVEDLRVAPSISRPRQSPADAYAFSSAVTPTPEPVL